MREEGLVTREVLVETFLPGQPLTRLLARNDMTADARAALARHGLRAFLQMLIHHNFVHADLHPGNILVDDSVEPPRVGFVDAGLVVRLSPRDQRNFLAVFHAVATADGDRVAHLMLTHAPQQRCTDPAAFRAAMSALVAEARPDFC